MKRNLEKHYPVTLRRSEAEPKSLSALGVEILRRCAPQNDSSLLKPYVY